MTKINELRKEGKSYSQIKIYLHLYSDMYVKNEINYWSNQLNINLENFYKTYIKKTNKMFIDQKGFGHGTCIVVYNNTELKESLLMSIKVLSDYFGGKTASI